MKPSTPNKREDEGIMAEMKDAAFLAEADSWIDAHWEEIVEEIGNLVAVPSVVDFDARAPQRPRRARRHDGSARFGFSSGLSDHR